MFTILIFAHVPPPHHGQSYMVAQLLEELRARPGEVRVFHVDARVSDNLQAVGQAGVGKVFRTLRYCWRAIRLRWQHGPMVFYYVPAPAKRGALLRDWLVMALCRPFFRGQIVFHWHTVGLGAWIQKGADPVTAALTRRLLGGADLSLVLARAVAADAEVFRPKAVRVLPNGIPDPCPDFDARVLPARMGRTRARHEGAPFAILFLAHCAREKGLYDALKGVFRAQRTLARAGSPTRLALTVAGEFLSAEERQAFTETLAALNKKAADDGEPYPSVDYIGFADGDRKRQIFAESDCFCFPTFYPNEVMPVTLIEALAFGLPIVSTRWRAIPEMLPAVGCVLVEPRDVEAVAAALIAALRVAEFPALRAHFLANYQRGVFGERFCALVRERFVEPDPGKSGSV